MFSGISREINSESLLIHSAKLGREVRRGVGMSRRQIDRQFPGDALVGPSTKGRITLHAKPASRFRRAFEEVERHRRHPVFGSDED
jgi:hypothetical protein